MRITYSVVGNNHEAPVETFGDAVTLHRFNPGPTQIWLVVDGQRVVAVPEVFNRTVIVAPADPSAGNGGENRIIRSAVFIGDEGVSTVELTSDQGTNYHLNGLKTQVPLLTINLVEKEISIQWPNENPTPVYPG